MLRFLLKICYFVLCLQVFLPATGLAQTRGLGADFDPEAYAQVPAAAPLARGDYLGAPPAMSLKAFAPPVGNQGGQGSCVGWATAYAARTVMKARENGVEGASRVRPLTLSPSFVFNQIHGPDCNGALLTKGLDVMQYMGVPLLADFPYSENSCSRSPTSEILDQADRFRIKGYVRLWGSAGRNRHVSARRALANGNPVVIGMGVGDGFMWHEGAGLWRPDANERRAVTEFADPMRSGLLGGHAMTVIGYDDTRDGGAFEVMNSWGTDWGNGGYFWISYGDFNQFVFEGYEVLPLDPPPPPRVVDMGGSLAFRHISGEDLAGRAAPDGTWRLSRSLPSGTRFRVEAKSDHTGNLYVIGGDATGDYVALFPRDGTISPHAQAGATLLLPGPTEQYFTRLNDTVGTDFYIALFAQGQIDAAEIAAAMEQRSGTPRQRLQAVLGDRLVAASDMEGTGTGIGFEAVSGDADVAAVIVEIDHIAPGPDAGDTAAPLIVLTEPLIESFDSDEDPITVATRSFVLEGTAQDENPIAALRIDGAVSSRFSSRGPFRAEVELPPGPGPHPITITTEDSLGNMARRTFRFQPRIN